MPQNKYLNLAEEFFLKIKKKYLQNKIFHSFSKEIVFLEDYAFLINLLNDLYDKTMNFKYKELAKKMTNETIEKFYISEKDIFQKNVIDKNDIFFKPIDISDSTIPNGNALMLKFSKIRMNNYAENYRIV